MRKGQHQRPHYRRLKGTRFTAGKGGLTLNKWKYLTHEKQDRKIPNRKYYVTMTDKFMSGWGRAQGMTNKYVVGTDFYDEAVRIRNAAERRKEMKYVNIVSSKPRYNPKYYLTSYNDAATLGEIWRGQPGHHW